MKRLTVGVVSLVLLAGCAANNTLPERKLADGQPYLAPIYVTVNDPFKAAVMRNHLRQTGVFRDIKTGTVKDDDYSVNVDMKMAYDYPPFPVVLLSCATLFMLPLSKEINTHTQFTLMQGNKTLKQYSYSNDTQKYTFLLDQGGEMEGQNLSRIARAFAQDVQQDHLIPVTGDAQ